MGHDSWDYGSLPTVELPKKRGPDIGRTRRRGGETVAGFMPGDGDIGREAQGLAVDSVKSAAGVVDFRAYVYVALMVVIGSTTAAAARYAVRDLPVALVPVLRFGLAGLCLLPVVWGPGRSQADWFARICGFCSFRRRFACRSTRGFFSARPDWGQPRTSGSFTQPARWLFCCWPGR